ncbi:MAG: nitrite/sulfite reductase [Acidobacteria bacterium]|nr:nitrite/sulfite reductase [Acidobacteriota bacterium]
MPIDEAVRTHAPARRFAAPKDLEEFVTTLEAYERGEIGADEFRTFRLMRGIYGQRQDDVQMIRVKIPQGILSGEQLRALAVVARDCSRGFGHVTTRQNVQFHFVKMAVVPKAMDALEAAGLTTREACGNTVRNITACPMAGVCPDEPFDVTPYGEALTRFFLRNPICQALPRKFKIALSGCPTDCAMGAMHDIGIIARTREADGRREIGFKVVIGGGLSVSPQNAWVLHEFLPPERLLPVCEAVVRVFDRTGNRKNKGQARMKYAIRKLGFGTFKAEIEKELAALPPVRDPAIGTFIVEDARPERPEAPADLHDVITHSGTPAFRAWAATNTRPQRQAGYSMAFVTLARGDITAAQLEAIATIAETSGSGAVRTAQDQNMLLRWVKSEELPAVYRELERIGLGLGEAGRLLDPTSCPGAESCKIAVTGSRELALAVKDSLTAAAGNGGKDLIAAASDLRIKISGCPNSCGQHHVAGIGFHGAAKHVGDRGVPAYQMLLGGSVDGEGAHFGRRSVKIPARRVPEALARLLALYRDERAPDETALAFFKRVDLERVSTALSDLTTFSEKDLQEDDYKDLGSDRPFTVEVGEGECAT